MLKYFSVTIFILLFSVAQISCAPSFPNLPDVSQPVVQAAVQKNAPKTICLNMIVKNETDVIRRCLASVKPIISHWVIVDTGSTDGTQAMIKEFMKDVPGELHERPWVNFAHNRTEAVELAKDKADYLLFIDADEVLEFSNTFTMPRLDKDLYYIMTHFNGTKYLRAQLVNNHLDWKWLGVIHEVVDSPALQTRATLEGVFNVVRTDGARSKDPKKFHKDAAVLEAALKKEPDHARYQFYLAQSYRDAGEIELALRHYTKRVEMGGWDQEIFWSLLQIAILQEELKMPADTVIDSYQKAFKYRPSRAEPLYRLAEYHRKNENFLEGYRAALLGLTIKEPEEVLFLENWMYDYGMLFSFSICAYWSGRYTESQLACQLLLTNQQLPEAIRDRVEKNLWCCNTKITEANDMASHVAKVAQ